MEELRDAAELLYRGCVSKGIGMDVQFKSTEHEKKKKKVGSQRNPSKSCQPNFCLKACQV